MTVGHHDKSASFPISLSKQDKTSHLLEFGILAGPAIKVSIPPPNRLSAAVGGLIDNRLADGGE
jgi:hypothetical protein